MGTGGKVPGWLQRLLRPAAATLAVCAAVLAAHGNHALAVAATSRPPAVARTSSAPIRGGTTLMARTAVSGGLAIPSVVLVTIRVDHSAQPAYDVAVSYPRVSGPGALTAAESRIDAALAGAARAEVNGFEHGPDGNGLPASQPHFGPSTLTGTALTDFVGAGLLSVSLVGYQAYSGAAHGVSIPQTLSFDLATGARLQLADLFAPGSKYLETLSAASRAQLPHLLGELANTATIDDGTTPVAVNFAGWALTPFGLQITFNNYQVGPYAAGTPQVFLPFDSLAAVARRDGPLTIAAAAAGAVSGDHGMALLPATSPPIGGECGTVPDPEVFPPNPLTCSGGRVDVPAWDELAQLPTGPTSTGLAVLALGPRASLAEVRAAMCADVAGGYDEPSEELAGERLAAAYYGWQLTPSPATHFPADCTRRA